MSDWLPISTAPKDGSPILVWGPEDGDFESGYGVVWYDEDEEWFVEGDSGNVHYQYSH